MQAAYLFCMRRFDVQGPYLSEQLIIYPFFHPMSSVKIPLVFPQLLVTINLII